MNEDLITQRLSTYPYKDALNSPLSISKLKEEGYVEVFHLFCCASYIIYLTLRLLFALQANSELTILKDRRQNQGINYLVAYV